jgi:hypothetical protein
MVEKLHHPVVLANPLYAPQAPINHPEQTSMTIWRDEHHRIRYCLGCSCTMGQVSDYSTSWEALLALNAHVRQHAARLAQ